jgi:hypothetical protein
MEDLIECIILITQTMSTGVSLFDLGRLVVYIVPVFPELFVIGSDKTSVNETLHRNL